MIICLSMGRSTYRPSDAATPCTWVEVHPGVGGAWTDFQDGREVILFGAPSSSPARLFDYHRIYRGRHNALSLAIERMVFSRGATRLVLESPELEASARRALATHPSVVLEIVAAGARA